MKYLFLLYLLCVSSFALKAAEGTNSHNDTFSEKRKIDGAIGQKLEIESITWIGGWGLLIKHGNGTQQKMPVDFDQITLMVKNKGFSNTFQIPFSFKGVISSQKRNLYIVPLNDLYLPPGRYNLSLSFDKKEEIGKDAEKKNQNVPVFQMSVPEFVVLPNEDIKGSKIKESDIFTGDKDDSCELWHATLNAYYHCYHKDGNLFIKIRTEIVPVDKPVLGKIYAPYLKGDMPYLKETEQTYRVREHTALARLKIVITTGNKTKILYYPLPVYFSLSAGGKCEFTVCMKEGEWDEKKSRLNIEHLTTPEGMYGNIDSPFSKMIFHKETNT